MEGQSFDSIYIHKYCPGSTKFPIKCYILYRGTLKIAHYLYTVLQLLAPRLPTGTFSLDPTGGGLLPQESGLSPPFSDPCEQSNVKFQLPLCHVEQ